MAPEPPTDSKAERVCTAICLLVLTGLLAGGIGTIAASFVPFSVLLAKARAMSARGDVLFFDQNFYRGMQFRLRCLGFGNLALAALGITFREHIRTMMKQVWRDGGQVCKDLSSAAMSMTPTERVGLFGLTLFSALLRFPLLFQPMRGDEAYTFLTYASHPFYVGLSFYNDTNNHLFHTLLMRLSYLMLGNHPWALRLPVFCAGLCLVPATYVASRSLFRRESALLAAGLVAASSPLIEYSTNARGYELLCLEFITLIAVAVYALRENNLAAWAGLTALAAIGFYTMPIMLYPFGGIVVWLLLSVIVGERGVAKWAAFKKIAVAVSLGALATIELYSPVLAISGPGAVFGRKLAQPKPLPEVLREMPLALAATWRQWNRDLPLWVTVALTAGFFLAVLFHRRLGRQRLSIALAMALWIVPLLALQRVVPMDRVWLFALPLYLIVASAGCSLLLTPLLARTHIRHAMVVVAIVVSLLLAFRVKRNGSVYLANEGRGMEEIAVYLKGYLKPGDSLVAVVPSDTLLLYYFKQHRVPSSYLNAPGGDRVLVIVNEQQGDTLRTVLESANRPRLEEEPSRLAARYETASLYEIAAQRAAEASPSF
jgi:hypothetical protein